jgi:hypothetical protein
VTDMFARSIKRFSDWSYSFIATAIVLTLCGIAAIGGLGFVAVGGYSSLIETLEPWAAGLIVGGVILLLSLLGIWVTIAFWKKRTHTQPPEKPPLTTAEAQTTVDTAARLGEFMGSRLSKSGIRTTDVTIAALVAGTILGASPSIRKRLSNRKRHKHTSDPSQLDPFDKYK